MCMTRFEKISNNLSYLNKKNWSNMLVVKFYKEIFMNRNVRTLFFNFLKSCTCTTALGFQLFKASWNTLVTLLITLHQYHTRMCWLVKLWQIYSDLSNSSNVHFVKFLDIMVATDSSHITQAVVMYFSIQPLLKSSVSMCDVRLFLYS